MTKTTEQTPKRMNVADPELQAMAKIDGILADLDDDGQGRVMLWLWDRQMGVAAPLTIDLPNLVVRLTALEAEVVRLRSKVEPAHAG